MKHDRRVVARALFARSDAVTAKFFAVAFFIVACLQAHVAPALAQQVINGSFETGDFQNWVTADLSSPFYPLHVGGAGESPGFGFFSSAPTDGSFAALHGFDGCGPGRIRIAQDVTLPPASACNSRILEFDYRAAWDLVTYATDPQDRTFEVQIQPAGGGAPLETFVILTAPSETIVTDTGNIAADLDLSGFPGGASIRISFEWDVPQCFTGPAFFQLDNVRLSSSADPAGTTCDDADACTQTDECDGGGTCVGSDPVICTAFDQCHETGTCNPSSGVCDDPAKPNDTVCDDGDACTLDDTCQAGACQPGGPTLLMPVADVDQTLQCVAQTVGGVLP